jgi:undecaprenyl-phosphate 4-deoxy-4-formamido-L-arabinose transferase
MNKHVKISVVVPTYNSGDSIVELINSVITVINNQFNELSELIIVDDSSKDNTWELIKEQNSKYANQLKAIRLSRNFGQHNATLCGFKYAENDYVITLDDDLEYNPSDIHALLKKLIDNDLDVVYGVDIKKQKNSFRKYLGEFYKNIAKIYYGKDRAVGSSFRIIKKSLAKNILQHARHFSFIDEFILWHTSKVGVAMVKCSRSQIHKSRYSLLKLINLTFKLIFLSSTIPLKAVKITGLVLSIFNFAYALVLIYKKVFFFIKIDGYTSLMVTILFSSGLIIFSLGVIADYINKLLKISYNCPPFKEDEVL